MPTKGSGTSVYQYSMGILAGVCRGSIDAIISIKVGELIAWVGNVSTTTSFQIDNANLFGGNQAEGGISGKMDVLLGAVDQVLPQDIIDSLNGVGLVSVQDSFGVGGGLTVIPSGTGLVSGLRGITSLFYRGQVSTNNPYLKPWMFRVRRTTQGWDGGCWHPELATITLQADLAPAVVQISSTSNDPATYSAPIVQDQTVAAMNPAHIIYECATNSLWGRGLDRSLMDDAAFLLAAQTLFNEGFGLCLRWGRADTLSSFIQHVVDHIGAAIYIDRTTGLFTIKLIRADYDPDSLPLFDANSGLLDITEDTAASIDSSPNEIIVKYHDPVQDQDRETRAQALAAINSVGSLISVTTTYEGIPEGTLASRVALRDLAVAAAGLKRYVVKCDRRAWRLAPAGVFRISAPDRGVSNMILRIGKIEDSTGEDSSILLTCVEDVFGMPDAGFVGIQQPLWSQPNNVPAVPSRRAVREANYRDLTINLTATELATVDATSGALSVLASRPNQLSARYDLNTKTGSEAFVDRGTGHWCPTGMLSAAITEYQTAVTFVLGSDWSNVIVGMALLIDNEWTRLDAFNAVTGVATIARGCIDTIPAPHAAMAFAFFADGWEATDGREYVVSEVISVQVLTRTSVALLSTTVAPVDTITIVARQNLPYPPGAVEVDGVGYAVLPLHGSTPNDRVLTWTHRDRLTQLDDLVPHGSGNIGPEAGTTYTVRVYDPVAGTLLRTVTGIATNTWTYTTVMQGADAMSLRVRMELESSRDGLASFQKYSFIVPLTLGWGDNWGYNWGTQV